MELITKEDENNIFITSSSYSFIDLRKGKENFFKTIIYSNTKNINNKNDEEKNEENYLSNNNINNNNNLNNLNDNINENLNNNLNDILFTLHFKSKFNSPSNTDIVFFSPELILDMDVWIEIGIFVKILNPEIDNLLFLVQQLIDPENISVTPISVCFTFLFFSYLLFFLI